MTRNELVRKIVETSVLVHVTSDPKEKECYLVVLMHYENQLRHKSHTRLRSQANIQLRLRRASLPHNVNACRIG